MHQNITALNAEVERQDEVNPDEIKTDELSLPEDEADPGFLEYKLKKVAELSDLSEIERELNKGPRYKDYWNKITEKEIDDL